jgi:predicted phosphodiesterase
MQLFKVLATILLLFTLFSCSTPTKKEIGSMSESESREPYITNQPRAIKDVKIAIIGDQGVTKHSKNLLRVIKSQKADLLLINGDFGYSAAPKVWEKMNRDILGEDFPILAVAGNHDVDFWPEYQEIIEKWQSHPKISCSGEAGVMSACSFQGVKILLSAPAVFDEKSKEESALFIKKSFENDHSIWRICGWHKNMHDMQTGAKGDETGWGVYEACREEGALITTGHEHAYARSFLLSDIKNKVVASTSDEMVLEKGKTVVVLSGLGGHSTREILNDDYWWAAEANANTQTEAGALFCTFHIDGDARKASCYYMSEDGEVLDRFTFRSHLN